MTPRRWKRLWIVAAMVTGIAIAVGLAFQAFQENLLYYYGPTEVHAGEVPPGAKFRLGGLVVPGSVQRKNNQLAVHFVLTDNAKSVPVVYAGILPDLFREGQGIVAHGKMDDAGTFVADEVLAKHDENYMPPEVADALEAVRKSGTLATPGG